MLNGDDPRVWAMRAGIKARPWVFSLDPDSPTLRESLNLGGRAVTVLDGDVVVLRPHGDPDHLVPIVDVPVTLSGLSEHNIANALAATAAARGEHEAEAAIAELRADPDGQARIAAAQSLADTDPSDPRLTFELASAYDGLGDTVRAIVLYDKAVGAGRGAGRRGRSDQRPALPLR